MPEYHAPDVHVEETRSFPAIPGAPTSVTAFAGWAPQGPLAEAVPVRSRADFDALFGGGRSLLGSAVRHFFDNGGSDALVVRVAGPRGGTVRPGSAAFRKALLGARGGVSLLARAGFNLLCVPGETVPGTLGELQRFCLEHRAFLIADCDRRATVASLTNGPDPALLGSGAENAALYFPWIRARDPWTGWVRAFPPCGFVAGVCARTDASRGVWKAPAGLDAGLRGASGPAVSVSAAQQGLLNGRAINCIRGIPAVGPVIWGARTLAGGDTGASEWRYIPIRRFALFIEQSIDEATQWVVFEPSGEATWARLRAQVEAFLMGLFRQGAFQGAKSNEAFFVRCDRSTMTQADVKSGIVRCDVGFAPLRPAEFIILRFAWIPAA